MGFLQNVRLLFQKKPQYYYNFNFQEEDPYVEGLSARDLFRTQANLHSTITFIADNFSQLPLKVYRREDETTRIRDRDSKIAQLIRKPNVDQTAYEFWNATMIEYLLYGEAIVLLLKDDSPSGYQLRIIPSEWIIKREYDSLYAVKNYYVRANDASSTTIISAENCIVFKMYNPGNPVGYQSPIASLKQTLSEQIQANRFRTAVWQSSGRLNAYITRPANVQAWTKETRDAWIEAFRKGWSENGQRSGSMPILEDGMEIKPYSFNAKEAQYAESIQLSREDVAAAYHINSSLIWHTNTQTYASAKDNARALYAECLGPLIQMFQQRINSFLIPMIEEDPAIYVEFDLDEKLKGSFEERAEIFQRAAGVPYLTVNEVRAELNRPPISGGDERVIPLNVLIGGQASPQDASPDSYSNSYASAEPPKMKAPAKVEKEKNSIKFNTAASDDEIAQFKNALEKFFKRQEASISTKLKAVENWWDEERWDRELAEDLYPILMVVSESLGRQIAADLSAIYYSENTESYLQKLAETRAHYINEQTYDSLLNAQVTGESTKDVFAQRILDALIIAPALASTAKEFAVNEAIDQATYQGKLGAHSITKTWHTGPNARDSHAAMNGETVDYDELFSNGLRWPHDWGPADQTCGCNCSVDVDISF